MKVLGRGIIDVGHKSIRIFCLHGPIQALEIAFNSTATQPPNHRCRDLIAKGIAKQSGMTGADTCLTPNQFFDIRGVFPIDEIACVLFGREPHHDPKAVPLSNIEKIPWWRGMGNTDGIQSVGGHQRKVPLYNFSLMVLLAVWTRPESSIGDATNPQFISANE